MLLSALGNAKLHILPRVLDGQGGKLKDAQHCLDTFCQYLDSMGRQKRVAEFASPKMAPNTSSPWHAGGIHYTFRLISGEWTVGHRYTNHLSGVTNFESVSSVPLSMYHREFEITGTVMPISIASDLKNQHQVQHRRFRANKQSSYLKTNRTSHIELGGTK